MRSAQRHIDVWDPFVRAFHWSLVLTYLSAWLSAEDWAGLHDRLGYIVLTLLALRLVWGVMGSEHARFSGFVRSPADTLAYLRSLAGDRPKHYLGHNPAGGWMVILLIATLITTAVSGIMLDGDQEVWEELHEGLANLSLLLVGTHIAGVITSSLLHRENLVRSMLTGRKLRNENDV